MQAEDPRARNQRPKSAECKVRRLKGIDGKPIYWRDGRGVVHACEGADIHPGVRVLWTLCGKDVPADTAYQAEGEVITCPICRELVVEQGERSPT
jgi:hypothetical protein